MADEPEDELCEDATLSDSQVWIPKVDAFCAKHGIVAIAYHEGGTYAYVDGRGEVPLSDLLKEKRGKVTEIRGGKP